MCWQPSPLTAGQHAGVPLCMAWPVGGGLGSQPGRHVLLRQHPPLSNVGQILQATLGAGQLTRSPVAALQAVPAGQQTLPFVPMQYCVVLQQPSGYDFVPPGQHVKLLLPGIARQVEPSGQQYTVPFGALHSAAGLQQVPSGVGVLPPSQQMRLVEPSAAVTTLEPQLQHTPSTGAAAVAGLSSVEQGSKQQPVTFWGSW